MGREEEEEEAWRGLGEDGVDTGNMIHGTNSIDVDFNGFSYAIHSIQNQVLFRSLLYLQPQP